MDRDQVSVRIRVKLHPLGRIGPGELAVLERLLDAWGPSESFAFGERAEIAGGDVDVSVPGVRVVPGTAMYALSETSLYLAYLAKQGAFRKSPACTVIPRAGIHAVTRRFVRPPDTSEFATLRLLDAVGGELATLEGRWIPGFGGASTLVTRFSEITLELGFPEESFGF